MNSKIRIFFTKVLWRLFMNNPLCTSSVRRKVLNLLGANIGKNTFIGTNVYFDKVIIGNNVFLGMNSLICKPVKIGNNCIVGGGSVITHDLPDNCFAAGVPCKIIKENAYEKEEN